jgi:hypothetical protein
VHHGQVHVRRSFGEADDRVSVRGKRPVADGVPVELDASGVRDQALGLGQNLLGDRLRIVGHGDPAEATRQDQAAVELLLQRARGGEHDAPQQLGAGRAVGEETR